MAIAIDLNVGPQGIALGDGTDVQARAGRTGDMIVSELHGRYFEQMRAARLFSAANQAIIATSVGLTTTYTGFLLYNPLNSGKVLVPNKVQLAITTTAAAAGGLLQGYSAAGPITAGATKVTPQGSQNNQIGNSITGAGIAYSAATITTPTILAALWTINATTAIQNFLTDLEGVFGVLPGGFVGIYTSAAVSGFAFMSWEEVDLPL
jgi:hypothetical protein